MLFYLICIVLVCFFTFKPIIQMLAQAEGEEVELCKDIPTEDDAEDDTEEEKELEDKWSEDPFQIVSIANADVNYHQVCFLQRSYFDSQHIEIPKQPPRLIL